MDKKKLYIISDGDTTVDEYTDKHWDVLLKLSSGCAKRRRDNVVKTSDSNFHIVYGYKCPNIGLYVIANQYLDDTYFARFVDELYNKDNSVMIYAVHG